MSTVEQRAGRLSKSRTIPLSGGSRPIAWTTLERAPASLRGESGPKRCSAAVAIVAISARSPPFPCRRSDTPVASSPAKPLTETLTAMSPSATLATIRTLLMGERAVWPPAEAAELPWLARREPEPLPATRLSRQRSATSSAFARWSSSLAQARRPRSARRDPTAPPEPDRATNRSYRRAPGRRAHSQPAPLTLAAQPDRPPPQEAAIQALGMRPRERLSAALDSCSLQNAAVMPFGARLMPDIDAASRRSGSEGRRARPRLTGPRSGP